MRRYSWEQFDEHVLRRGDSLCAGLEGAQNPLPRSRRPPSGLLGLLRVRPGSDIGLHRPRRLCHRLGVPRPVIVLFETHSGEEPFASEDALLLLPHRRSRTRSRICIRRRNYYIRYSERRQLGGGPVPLDHLRLRSGYPTEPTVPPSTRIYAVLGNSRRVEGSSAYPSSATVSSACSSSMCTEPFHTNLGAENCIEFLYLQF